MDAQTAMMFGQQSSQPGGFPGSSQKSSGNEDLALALAAMASGGATQNAVLGGGFTDTSGGNALQQSMLGGWGGTPQQAGTVSSVLGNVNTGLGAVKTGTQLWGAGQSLYDAMFGGNSADAIGDVGTTITALNLGSDLSSSAPAALDMYDWWTWGGY